MVHFWKIVNDNLVMELEEILKYPLLRDIYVADKSPNKANSHEYFKYLDFMTASSGYCVKNGLTYNESKTYSSKQVVFPKDFVIPTNDKDIVKYIRDQIEYDPINEAVLAAIKAFRVSAKSLNMYVDNLNEAAENNFKDKEGNIIDVQASISKSLALIAKIPTDIETFNGLLEKQAKAKISMRGSGSFSSSMDSDNELGKFEEDEDDD